MATVAQIKAALTNGANIFGSGRIIGDAEVARIKAWFESDYAEALDGAAMSADDLSEWLARQVRGKVIQYERRVAQNALAEPGDLTE